MTLSPFSSYRTTRRIHCNLWNAIGVHMHCTTQWPWRLSNELSLVSAMGARHMTVLKYNDAGRIYEAGQYGLIWRVYKRLRFQSGSHFYVVYPLIMWARNIATSKRKSLSKFTYNDELLLHWKLSFSHLYLYLYYTCSFIKQCVAITSCYFAWTNCAFA